VDGSVYQGAWGCVDTAKKKGAADATRGVQKKEAKNQNQPQTKTKKKKKKNTTKPQKKKKRKKKKLRIAALQMNSSKGAKEEA